MFKPIYDTLCFSQAISRSLLLFGLLSLVGCGGKSYPMVFLSKVTVVADQDANINSVIPFDIVIACDGPLFDEVSKLTSKDFYQRREQLVLDHPQKLQVIPFELDPGQTIEHKIKRKCLRRKGALIFAGYGTAGTHRIRVANQRHLYVRLKNQMMKIESK